MRNHQPAEPAASTENAAHPRDAAPDPLEAFPTEAQVAATAARQGRRRVTVVRLLAVGAGSAVIVATVWLLVSGTAGWVRRGFGLSLASTRGTLVIETIPPGWEVLEGARSLGTTPLRASLEPGKHSLLLRHGGATRPLDVVLQAGMQMFHHLDLQGESSTGELNIATSPPGAIVTVDGVHCGVSPVDVAGLAPGDHVVSMTVGGRVVTEQVSVFPGRTTTLVVPIARRENPGAVVGFAAIESAIELQVFDGDSLVGSSRNQRIMLMPGRRTLRLANPALGFERTLDVTIEAGTVARVNVPVPNGSLSVNAVPWAEVVLDGTAIGETPIANHVVPLGAHEIVLRNPKFPEYRRTIVVSLTAPTRIGVDLRQ
jgi:hypothetical protein